MSYFPWKNTASWFVTLFLSTKKYTAGNKEGATRGGGWGGALGPRFPPASSSLRSSWGAKLLCEWNAAMKTFQWLPGSSHMCWHACGQRSLVGYLSRLVFPRAFHWQTLPPGTEGQRFWNKPWWEKGEKKLWLAQTTWKKKVQLRAFNITQNSCYLLFMHLGLAFPSLLMQSLLDFSKRGPCSSLLCSLSWMLKGPVFRTSWLPIPIRHQYSGSVCPFPGQNQGSKLQAREWPSQATSHFRDLKY